MDTRSIAPATAPDLVATTTTPRPTPRPARVRFAEVLAGGARGLVRGAEAAMRALPGMPVVSTAVRGAAPSPSMAGSLAESAGAGVAGGALSLASAPAGSLGGAGGVGAAGVGAGGVAGGAASAEGPGGSSSLGASVAAPGGDGGVDASLQQAQEMNLYYLQIQEAVNAQNRTFSALSNVLKAEHDTVKTAIGNIR